MHLLRRIPVLSGRDLFTVITELMVNRQRFHKSFWNHWMDEKVERGIDYRNTLVCL